MKHWWNTGENTGETLVKHLWNTGETHLKTLVKHLWNTVSDNLGWCQLYQSIIFLKLFDDRLRDWETEWQSRAIGRGALAPKKKERKKHKAKNYSVFIDILWQIKLHINSGIESCDC